MSPRLSSRSRRTRRWRRPCPDWRRENAWFPWSDAGGRLLGGLTPLSLARAYAQIAGGQTRASDQTGRAYVEELPTVAAGDRIRDRRGALLRGGGEEFLIVGEGGQYVGTASRRCLLDPPRARLILVDHNELAQAVTGGR